jgi:hypothetical protein
LILFVYLYAKSTIPDARARNPNIFFSALAVEALLPTARYEKAGFAKLVDASAAMGANLALAR